MNKFKRFLWKHMVITGGIAVVLSYIVTTLLLPTTVKPKTASDFAKTSVMITRYDGRSGGTGVIISSKKNESKILTNAHVCSVITSGGIVRSDYKKAMIKYYQISNVHDLCLITVNSDFKVNTVLAKEEPEIYSDAIVSGHPRLQKNIVTYGHFSGHDLITIMVGTRVCTPEEKENPLTTITCLFLGGIPVQKTYEAQLTSNTIQPGSSGSAVFNKDGELAGLVFAGSGEFGFAYVVPYEYLVSFFDIELSHLLQTIPNQNQSTDSLDVSKKDWKKSCLKNLNDDKIQEVCDLITKSLFLTN